MKQAQRQKLTELAGESVSWQCPLDRYTSLAIGGPAEALVTLHRRSQLQQLLIFLAEEDIAWRVIGRGTNLLVSDGGFAGVIITLAGEFAAVEKKETLSENEVQLTGGGGCALGGLVGRCTKWGLTGLEFACGIPGTLGGAVVMNAGAWGSDMAAIVHGVTLMTAAGEVQFCRSELDFSYRCWQGFTAYQGKAVVTDVLLALSPGDSAAIKQQCQSLQDRRQELQGCRYPNAGSFFKNPPGDSAGRLIDCCGLKGTSIGGAMISEHHGNFLVNRGGATADDVLKLMRLVQAKVKTDCGLDLEPEVHFIGK